jgi:uncharacterized protein
MTRSSVIVDTGILVALIDSRDQYHPWVSTQLKQITPPMLTCEAVISEAWFLLARVRNGHATLAQLLERQQIQVQFNLAAELASVLKLLNQYSTVPVSLADAELVRMSELYANHQIFTLDSDFQIYRKNRNQMISVISPWSN